MKTRMNKPAALVLGLLSFSFGLGSIRAEAHAPVQGQFSTATAACTDRENWSYGLGIQAAWRQRFTKVPTDKRAAVLYFTNAYAIRTTSTLSETQALGEYAMGRAFFGLKMLHLAHDKFNSTLSMPENPTTDGIKLATLECLNVIHKNYPTLTLSKESAHSLQAMLTSNLTEPQKMQVYGALAEYLERLPNFEVEKEIFETVRAVGIYGSYLSTLNAARTGDDAEVIRNAEAFLKTAAVDGVIKTATLLPDDIKDRVDGVHLILGQAYYELGKYAEATTQFRAVKNTSNYLSQSLTNLSWSYLMNTRYDDALGAARNLLLGGLARTFAPEANVVTAISFVETCHFAEALQSVKLFRDSYRNSYAWLYNWNQALPGSGNLYDKAVKYLKKKETLPDRIATEWIRSPVFLATQEELNLMYDERAAGKWANYTLGQLYKANKKLQPYLVPLQTLVNRDAANSANLEHTLVARVNLDLVKRSKQMLVSIADLWENGQLIEVESYNQVGDKIVQDQFGAEVKEIAKNMKKNKRDEGAVWDWGRAPASDGSGEFWEDELGFLKATLVSQCSNKKR